MLKATAKCEYCGNDVVLPFKCAYCGGSFCAEHRIPESHACPETWRAKAPREAPSVSTQGWSKEPSYKYTISYMPQSSRIFWFSLTELKHLALGTLLVLCVGLSFFYLESASTLVLVSLSVAFTLSFLLHELAHKFSAQHFHLWAEFRLTMQGALITLISIFIPPPFKIISPGAVMIAGSATRETVGKTALSGPLTNIILSAGCIIIATFSQEIFWIVAFINAFLAAFNLIPFGIIDGLKIYRWNKMIWALAFIAAIALAGATLLLF
jgi:Zn-dependent protease